MEHDKSLRESLESASTVCSTNEIFYSPKPIKIL